MTPIEAENLATIRAYFAAVEAGGVGDVSRFYAEDVVQIELPNRLNPNGAQSDLATLKKRAEQVPHLLRGQRYEVISEMAQGSRVVVEAIWTGVLAVPFGTLEPGSTMKAHFAMFFELRDGRIVFQRNYDCFEPW
jgi:ketosteroid isomerase-like protein